MISKKAVECCFPFIGNQNIKQLLKFAEAYHPLDFLTVTIIDYITAYKENVDGPLEHILGGLINWIEREILGKVKSFKELETLLYVQSKPMEGTPRGIKELIEAMIPYRYYEVLSADDIKLFKDTAEKIYKDAINEALSMAMDKPSLMPEQSYEEDKSKVPVYQQEDSLTPWLMGSEYERI